MREKVLFKQVTTTLLALVLVIGMLPAMSLKAKAATTYDIWLGSTQVTSENMNRIPCSTGYAMYDPGTNTLTFNNVHAIKGSYKYNGLNCLVYSKKAIKIKGAASLAVDSSISMIIACDSDLSIQGDFSLSGGDTAFFSNGATNISGSNTRIVITGSGHGFISRKDIEISDGTIFVKTTYDAINSAYDGCDLSIFGGEIYLNAEKAIQLFGISDISLYNNMKIVSPEKYTIEKLSDYTTVKDVNGKAANTIEIKYVKPAPTGENLGSKTIDLTSGMNSADPYTITYMQNTFYNLSTKKVGHKDNTDTDDYDLDNDGNYDIRCIYSPDWIFCALPTTNLKNKTYKIELNETEIEKALYSGKKFYDSITFKFSDKTTTEKKHYYGQYVVDLSNGSFSISNFEEIEAFEHAIHVLVGFESDKENLFEYNEEECFAIIDLDGNGTFDISYKMPHMNSEKYDKTYIDVLPTNSIKDNIILSMTSREIEFCEESSYAYFDKITFYFSKEVLAEDANTPKVENAPAHAVGDVIVDNGVSYKISSVEEGKQTVTFVKPENNKTTNGTVPDAITVDNTEYKVTEIADNAFKGNKKLKKTTIGKNVTKIGKNAYSGCKNLKSVKINTPLLTKKAVGKNAFKGIHAKAKVKVPKKQLKNYKKFLSSRGINGKDQKITK
ncbi:MAG: carbohydrate-binding domain-containing protein [Butyrivibrio sp.]|nr:carbohydrate-binding domain-containing protein [Butyrivibrio sp.]